MTVPYRLKPGRLTSHGRIVEFLARFTRDIRILDVGAATGYLGAALLEKGFCAVSGIEADPEQASRAQPFYERLVVADIERDPLPWSEAAFDVVICADVLEHLREPASALRRLTGLLVAGGWVVASLPNIAHWSVRCSLLCGRFNYANSGLLDQGHLRFFTLATARRLLHEAKLAVRGEVATPLPLAHWCDGSFMTPVWRVVEYLDWCFARCYPSLCAYQVVLMAQRSNTEPLAP